MRNRPSCIVIGAGLAGLAAAYRLSKRGWKVDVVEAQHRLGGRVFSHHFERDASGLVCELGAEWIGEDHGRVLKLCEALHLEKRPHQFSLSFWDSIRGRGRIYGPKAWCFSKKLQKKFDRFASKYKNLTDTQARKLDDYDWWGKLQEIGFSQTALRKRDLMDSTDSGESIRLTSAYSAAGEYCIPYKSRTDEMDYKIVGGNQKLVDRLAEEISKPNKKTNTTNRIHMGLAVRSIIQEGRGVKVHVKVLAKDGSRGKGRVKRHAPFTAQFCICAVPTRSLLNIKWDPKIPPRQWDMARQLQYSRIMKSAVLYNRRFWKTPKSGGFSVFTNRASDFCFDSSHGQDGTNGILCSYAIGDKADDLASEPDPNLVAKWITEDVAAATKPHRKRRVTVLDFKFQPWQREKWIGGAYAFYRPGQWFTVMPALCVPHHRVHFAGEHLSGEWQGFMEGAIETGYRAANAVMRLGGGRGRFAVK